MFDEHKLCFIVRMVCILANLVSVFCFTMFLRKYFDRKPTWNPYTCLALYRAVIHITSAIADLIIAALGPIIVSTKEIEITFAVIINIAPLYFLFTEFIMTINRYIAIAYWKYYSRIFTSHHCNVLYSVPFIAVTFSCSWMWTYSSLTENQINHIIFVCTEVVTIAAFLINIKTFYLILRFKFNKARSTSGLSDAGHLQGYVQAYLFALFQLIVSSLLFVQLITPIGDNVYYNIIYYSAGNTFKDLAEGLGTVFFFRNLVLHGSVRPA